MIVRLKLFFSLLIPLAFLAHTLTFISIPLIPSLEIVAEDIRTRIFLPNAKNERIIIVDIDEKSLNQYGQWPWSRSLMGKMITNLSVDYEVKAIGLDMVFPEAEQLSMDLLIKLQDDNFVTFNQSLEKIKNALNVEDPLAQALKGKPVVSGFVFKNDSKLNLNKAPNPIAELDEDLAFRLNLPKPQSYTANINSIQDSAEIHGFFDNPLVDNDGLYRRASMLQIHNNKLYPSLSLALTRVATRSKSGKLPPINIVPRPLIESEPDGLLVIDEIQLGRYIIPLGAKGSARVPYLGPQGSFQYISASQVLSHKTTIETLRNKIILIGTTAPGLKDIRATPVDNQMAGVEVHANLIAGILNNSIPQQPSWALSIEVMQIILVGVLLLAALNYLSPENGILITGVILFLVISNNFYFWNQGLLLPITPVVSMVIIAYLFNISWSLLIESKNKKEITRMFGQYVPPELVDEMAKSHEQISIKGEARNLSVLFSDVRGFTTISENLEPEDLSELMNRLLTPLTEVIHSSRGTIDKYMGDAIMAFWGAPISTEDHANLAVQTAMDMQLAIKKLSPHFEDQGLPEIAMGIGINTGNMAVGNMGSEFRMAYTVMGDAVNLGARLEGLTRQYSVDTLVSEFTKTQASHYFFREIDCVKVKGKEEPVTIFQPLCPLDAVDEKLALHTEQFNQALKFYRSQKWEDANTLLTRLIEQDENSKDLYNIYLERIETMTDSRLPSDWDGVFVFSTK